MSGQEPLSGGDAAALAELTSLKRRLLLIGVFLVASCGIAYELIAGAVSTYLLGDGVLQFSLTIGIFLTAMGVGSFLSRFVRHNLLKTFIYLEIFIGVVGAALAPILLLVYSQGYPYIPVLIALLGIIGILAGMEIPILLRLLEHHEKLRLAASAVLGLDYAGALAGSLLVPILLIPLVGTIGAACLFGLVNLIVGALCVMAFPEALKNRKRWPMMTAIAVLSVPMVAGVVGADPLSRALEENLYQDPVVYAKNTQFQRVVLTRWRGDVRMFLNGSLQFSSKDEYRYHEALVHPGMAAAPRRARVLVMGGGDGLGVREVLKWDDVEHVDLVDLDPGVTELARTHPDLAQLNKGAFDHPKVSVHNVDALHFLESFDGEPWDVILLDLPDPSTPTLSRLYARSTYRLIARHLAADGVIATQATSPFFARKAFWCIHDTLEGIKPGGTGRPLIPHPYRVTVPSFGLWGFVLASPKPVDPRALVIPPESVATRHVTTDTLVGLFVIPPDERRDPDEERCVNHLNDAVLARTYRRGWARYGE